MKMKVLMGLFFMFVFSFQATAQDIFTVIQSVDMEKIKTILEEDKNSISTIVDYSVQNRKILQLIGESNPSILGNFMDIEQNYAYVTTMHGLDVIDISNPRSPEKVGGVVFQAAFEIEVYDHFAYIQSGAIHIVNISRPGNYSIDGRYSSGTRYSAMKGRGDYLFVACANSGLEILDISNPIQPVRHGKLEDSGYHIRLVLKDDIVYLADSESGLEIIDISELSSPSKQSTLQGTKGICGLALENDVMMIGTPKGLFFFDVSTPASPIQIACMTEFVRPRKMTAKGNVLFFMEGDGKMMFVVDYSDLQYPVIRGSYKESTYYLLFDGNYLFSVSISPQKKLSIFELNK